MSVGNPVMCSECGVLHGNHQPSCGRQEWENFKRRLNAIMREITTEDPHRVRSRILWEAEAEAFKRFSEPGGVPFKQFISAVGPLDERVPTCASLVQPEATAPLFEVEP